MLDLFEHPDGEPLPHHLSTLELMCEWGLSGDVLIPLLDMLGVKLSLDDQRFLSGPIIVHETGWKDSTPDWLYDLARAERFEIVVQKKPGLVGPAELTAVMYGAMMVAPRPRETVDLYLWASVNASARHYSRDAGEIWKSLDCPPIEDKDVIERGGRLWDDYRQLAEAIRRKVIAEVAGQEREERLREERNARQQAQWESNRARQQAAYQRRNEPPPEPKVSQPSMF